MRTINNQDAVARRINNMDLVGVEAIGDDGSVCVSVSGTAERVTVVANMITETVGDIPTGDGVQDGGIWINGNECNVHDELSSLTTI